MRCRPKSHASNDLGYPSAIRVRSEWHSVILRLAIYATFWSTLACASGLYFRYGPIAKYKPEAQVNRPEKQR